MLTQLKGESVASWIRVIVMELQRYRYILKAESSQICWWIGFGRSGKGEIKDVSSNFVSNGWCVIY